MVSPKSPKHLQVGLKFPKTSGKDLNPILLELNLCRDLKKPEKKKEKNIKFI